ncbi:hypothetical protein Patl1_27064 [Pistacia atlantica]|uniref:Uncharacterized protein n=1 Tax=Pistacia atlantica TaxID=434234 RepID=A0ACC1B530_9ROSI|nr:hypothetical protein Patl1_27064 [Pistacia atlantica]
MEQILSLPSSLLIQSEQQLQK